MLKSLRFSYLATIIFFLQFCVPEAPHDNPLDPVLSTSQNGITLTGTVYSYYQPYIPIKNTEIFISDAGLTVFSDSLGNFVLHNLAVKEYTFILSKNKYQTDTINVKIDANIKSQSQFFFLNAIPELKTLRYYSEQISSILAEPRLNAILEISFADFDGLSDLDSAFIWIPELSIKTDFEQTLTLDSLTAVITEDDLQDINFHSLIEKPLYVILKDKPGSKSINGPFYLGRIINDVPLPIAPSNQETALQPLFFTWEKVNLPYTFSLEINLYRQQSGLQTLIYTQKKIENELTNFSYTPILPKGIYFWTIAIRDGLNNMSRSQEAVFQIR